MVPDEILGWPPTHCFRFNCRVICFEWISSLSSFFLFPTPPQKNAEPSLCRRVHIPNMHLKTPSSPPRPVCASLRTDALLRTSGSMCFHLHTLLPTWILPDDPCRTRGYGTSWIKAPGTGSALHKRRPCSITPAEAREERWHRLRGQGDRSARQ